MNSILDSIENTLNSGDIYNTKNIIFEAICNKYLNKYLKREITITSVDSYDTFNKFLLYYRHYYSHTFNVIYDNLLTKIRFIKLYDLLDEFNISVDEVKLFCNSKYITKLHNYDVYSIQYNLNYKATYEKAIKFITENPDIDKKLLDDYKFSYKENIEFNDESKAVIREMILRIYITFSTEFLDEFKSYYTKEFEKQYNKLLNDINDINS